MPLTTWPKDPNAVLDFSLDWSDWLASAEALTCSVWTVESGITVDNESITTSVTTVWLSAGTAGTTYSCANKIGTDAGRIDERTIAIKVLQR